MTAPIRRVVMRRPADCMPGADPARWHYGPSFDPERAEAEHGAFARLLAAAGAEILWLGDGPDALADSVFTHDPSLVTDAGAVLLNMGKPLRAPEPALHRRLYQRLGIPVLDALEGGATVEGGDCLWIDRRTLAVGRGARTNAAGIARLAAILDPLGVEVLGFDLPWGQGPAACLHLMSLISPLAEDLALVHLPLMPHALVELLAARGVGLVEGCPQEFAASAGLSLNVLATAPGEAIAIEGYPRTCAAMDAAGVRVATFAAGALCLPCEGGPTCLTRPVWRA